MKNLNKVLTPEESIELISKTIANFKRNYKADSFSFLLWGWVISLASLSHFIVIKYLVYIKLDTKIGFYSLINWGIFLLIGWSIQYIHIIRTNRKAKVHSQIGRFISILWQATGFIILIVSVYTVALKTTPTAFILVVVALGTFVTGRVIKFKPLVVGGIIFLMGSVISFIIQLEFVKFQEYQLLVNAAALIGGYLIPGYILRASK